MPRWCTWRHARGPPDPVVCQPYDNLLNRMPEVEILPACAHHGIGVASYSRIAQRLKEHAAAKGVSLGQFATAWVLANRVVSSVTPGPRTFAQWQHYAPALDCVIDADDEALVDALVAPGHPSTPGFNQPAYPLIGRRVASAA